MIGQSLRPRGLLAVLFLLLVGLAPLQAVGLKPGERLEYTFSYQGVFSGFIEIDIARAAFMVAPEMRLIDGRETYQTEVDLSTEPFAKAELIYPIRFRYRSWLEPAQQTPLLVQEYSQTDEISEELLWFDHNKRLGFRYVKAHPSAESAAGPPASVLEPLGVNPAEWSALDEARPQPLGKGEVWDYLSLLYRLRSLELQQGRLFEIPLYNGKQIKTYRVEVIQERLIRAGWNLPTFKLSLYEMRSGARKGDSVTSIWISDDEERRPLRFYVERAVGVVEGILETGRPLTAQGEELPESTRKSLKLLF
jgi:hypothetical protein